MCYELKTARAHSGKRDHVIPGQRVHWSLPQCEQHVQEWVLLPGCPSAVPSQPVRSFSQTPAVHCSQASPEGRHALARICSLLWANQCSSEGEPCWASTPLAQHPTASLAGVHLPRCSSPYHYRWGTLNMASMHRRVFGQRWAAPARPAPAHRTSCPPGWSRPPRPAPAPPGSPRPAPAPAWPRCCWEPRCPRPAAPALPGPR